jgi:hypothetical protein
MTATLNFGEAVQLRVAIADQKALLGRMKALLPDSTQLSKPHPWFQTLGETAIAKLLAGQARLCPHLGPRRGFGPMYVLYSATEPMRFLCRQCWQHAKPEPSVLENFTCDRCAIYARGLISGLLPFGPLLMVFGVCGGCADELNGEQP